MDSKSELIKDLANGDSDAFKNIFNLLYPRMMGYCKLFIHDSFQAEDLVQDCFIQLWNKRKKLDPERNINRLMFVMLHNHCLNFLRDNQLSNSSLKLKDHYINYSQFLYQLDFIGEEEKSLEEQLQVSLQEAIDNLSVRQREVLIKTKIDGQSQKKVADELGITVKAIEKNISLAKKKIKKELIKKFPTLMILLFFFFQ